MSDLREDLARQVREALGEHNDDREAVVLLVQALVQLAVAARNALDEIGQGPDIQRLIEEHQIDELVPPVEPYDLDGVRFKVTLSAPTPRS